MTDYVIADYICRHRCRVSSCCTSCVGGAPADAVPVTNYGFATELKKTMGEDNRKATHAKASSQVMEGGMAVKAATGPHQLIASDHVVGVAVRRPNGTVLGHVEWLMIDKASGKCCTPCSVLAGFSALAST